MPVIVMLVMSVIARLFTGAIAAGLVYFLLKNQVMPQLDNLDNLDNKIMGQVSNLYGVDYIGPIVSFLDVSGMVIALLTTGAACFSIKLMMIAVRAFGVKT